MRPYHFVGLVALALVGATATSNTAAKFRCWDEVVGLCNNENSWDQSNCTPQWGAFPRLNHDTNGLISQQFESSIQYLLIASHFKHYTSYRPGFANYFRKLSDENWNEAISLLIHTIERGGHLQSNFTVEKPKDTEIYEIQALGKALDRERLTAYRTSTLAHLANHGKDVTHDSEFAEFLSERLRHNFVLRIKHLANYVTLLADITRNAGENKGYALFKFDSEYLK